MQPRQADIEIVARVCADKVRFDAAPHAQVRFPGTGRRDSRQVTSRKNIDKPVRQGKTYHRVFVETRISSRLLDDDGVG